MTFIGKYLIIFNFIEFKSREIDFKQKLTFFPFRQDRYVTSSRIFLKAQFSSFEYVIFPRLLRVLNPQGAAAVRASTALEFERSTRVF